MRKKVIHKSSLPLQVPALTPEEEYELDFDVCCCIEEIESTLLKNPTERQRKKAETSLKILRSPSELYVKKKQLMRQWCGNYKSKFEIKKRQVTACVNAQKFVFKKPKACQNSVCFQKYKLKSIGIGPCDSEFSVNNERNRDGTNVSNSSFKFEF